MAWGIWVGAAMACAGCQSAHKAHAVDAGSLPVAVSGYEDEIEFGIFRDGDLLIAGQPSEAAMRKLAAGGVTRVINLRTQREMDNRQAVPYDEAALLKELGVEYIHIPLGGDNHPYTPAAVDALAAALEGANGHALLHCTVAWRASHLWTAYLVRYRGMSFNEAYEHGRAINMGTMPVEQFLGVKMVMELEEG
jgi:uncharacterized protein (TIGR01244 family)